MYKGKAVVGVDESDTDFAYAGAYAGSKTVTLTTAQMPSHTHTSWLSIYNGYATYASGGGGFYPSQGTQQVASSSTGGGEAHTNLQPYQCTYFFLRTA